MRRLRLTLAAAVLLILAACGSENGTRTTSLPAARVTGVTPLELVPGSELTVSGANFFALSEASGMKIEVCGVVLNADVIEPLAQNILLPPGSFITAQVGHAVAGTVPEHGFSEGPSRVLVTRPDGNSAVLADAVTCLKEIWQPEPVVAVLAASATNAVAPTGITFDASASTGEGELQFSWDFGVEGATASGPEVSYEYQLAGEYTVTLTVTDSTAATATASQTVTINPPLQAVITADAVSGTVPLTVNFSGVDSTGVGDLQFEWDLGVDGATASGAEVSYEYGQVGTYSVTLTVTDETGAESVATEQITVDPVLLAVIRHGEISRYAPVTVTFDATGSTGIGPLTFEWDFGDGTPVSPDTEPAHEFTAGGTYTVALTVTDVHGATDTAEAELFIRPPAPVDAVITADVITGTAPFTVNFSGLASTGEGDLQYAWDFGIEGATSADAEAPFTFVRGGTYTVTLTVTDETGAAHSTAQVIEAAAEPASLSFVTEPAGLNPVGEISVTGEGVTDTVSLPAGSLRLPPGEYTVVAPSFMYSETIAGQSVNSEWRAAPEIVTLTEGEARTVMLGYEPAAGELQVTVNGLPAADHPDAFGIVPVHTPFGLPADTGDLSNLLPGIYEVTFSSVRGQHDGWAAEYVPAQAAVQVAVSSGQVAQVQVQYEMQPSLGIDVRFRYSDADVPFTLSGMNGNFTQDDDLIPPGEYLLSLRPVDYVNQAGQNGVSPTYERWTPNNPQRMVRLSSNEVTVIESEYKASQPVIRLTVTAPEDAVNFRSDVVVSGPSTISTNGAPSGFELDAAFGSYCVTVRNTYYFDVSGTDYPGGDRCFDINRASGYGGGNNTYSVRVDYRHKRVSFPDHPDGTASAGTIRYAYYIDEWFITEALITEVEIDGAFAGELPVRAPNRYKTQGTGTFEAPAGSRVRIGVTLLSQGVRWGPYWSPYLEVGP